MLVPRHVDYGKGLHHARDGKHHCMHASVISHPHSNLHFNVQTNESHD